ncbi:aspartate aminotransferase [Fusarium redolens]|uniref:Aspartate aminotransferase n=1 Tax=Fusarium redolens TaxID=48865 RepID=A0A9P9KSU0_FUSRE|nr:aspartate aminotransferase [Fusarium redolens]KAH7267785.1 aspartate aminotransferase [Fusarium redolens]
MFFDNVQQGAPDVMYELKLRADGDTDPNKVDLGVGIYRNEQGLYHELKALKDAKDHLAVTNPNHDYQVTTGNAEYLRNAARIVFGNGSNILESGRVASVQTISGTGSIHIALMFLSRSIQGMEKTVYVGTPTWGNYQPMCALAGLSFQPYRHYSPNTGRVDWNSVLEAVRGAAPGNIFILQACCHNPTAADFSQDQWKTLAKEMKARRLLPLFDMAYQGLGNGLDEDVFGLRHFAQEGFELLACQTFSKSFGLYGERVGALHAICTTSHVASAVHDQLRFLIRSEFSSSPAYGARLVTTILSDPTRESMWRKELNTIHQRLRALREKLFHLLHDVHKTPGNWEIITRGTGLFSLLPLTAKQCKTLQTKYHIYLVPNGRITIPGLNERNIKYVASSIDEVVRASETPIQHHI